MRLLQICFSLTFSDSREDLSAFCLTLTKDHRVCFTGPQLSLLLHKEIHHWAAIPFVLLPVLDVLDMKYETHDLQSIISGLSFQIDISYLF